MRTTARQETTMTRVRFLAALVAVTLSLPGLAAAHGGDTSLVHACVHSLTKAVRIVGVNATCVLPEVARHWSIAGPTGRQGPRGLQGVAGPVGPAGAPGAAG